MFLLSAYPNWCNHFLPWGFFACFLPAATSLQTGPAWSSIYTQCAHPGHAVFSFALLWRVLLGGQRGSRLRPPGSVRSRLGYLLALCPQVTALILWCLGFLTCEIRVIIRAPTSRADSRKHCINNAREVWLAQSIERSLALIAYYYPPQFPRAIFLKGELLHQKGMRASSALSVAKLPSGKVAPICTPTSEWQGLFFPHPH